MCSRTSTVETATTWCWSLGTREVPVRRSPPASCFAADAWDSPNSFVPLWSAGSAPRNPRRQQRWKTSRLLPLAVDQFLFDIANAGKIVMPREVALRYRELKWRIDEVLADPCNKDPGDSRGASMLVTWSVELGEIRRRYPPPRVSREIRELMHSRALRMLRGEDVSPEQDAMEMERIAAELEWPRS